MLLQKTTKLNERTFRFKKLILQDYLRNFDIYFLTIKINLSYDKSY